MQLRSRPLDVAEPPRIVFEGAATCADGHHHSEAELKQALSRARAPAPEWLVTVHIHKVAASGLQADGDITDERGAAVGHREFTGKANDCDGLARAVGVWASLVLDAEIRRPHPVGTESEQAADPAEGDAKSDPGRSRQTASLPRPRETSSDANSPSPDEQPLRKDEPPTLEVGVGGFVMSGIGGGGALLGATPFFSLALGKGVLLRPALAFGESLPGTGPATVWGAGRLDGCFQIAGRYSSRRGLQMDLCGGLDVGVLDVQFSASGSEKRVAYVAPGPSLDMRGELGGDIAVILRGVTGVNVVHQLDNTPILSGRGELAFSWSVQ